ncbi:DNA polymerase III subunit beta [Stakelama tenebrarum]|uniref:Beta sliding clamp n=1 Tax=Stakelama tenebrarum TaxID=2711215 RepID=A0A6G6Y546_9SPHN|nr:hypothetical protein [Sphingosinithalassobacter tenebrarum]QIG79971.1 hypothetical protein G5C33_09415 [Sphingosinithalassobacter tenebrarum]
MIEVERKTMLQAMELASMASMSRSTIPVLTALKAQANGALSFTGCDLNMAVEARCSYSGDAAAPFLIQNPRAVRHLLNHAGGKSVKLTPGEGGKDPLGIAAADIRAESSQDFHVDDFPVTPPISNVAFSATLAPAHIDALRRVSRAMSKEETRYYLNGVFLHRINEWTVRAVATDGHRLIVAALSLIDCDMPLDGVIIPRDAIKLITGPLSKGDGMAFRIGNAAPANAAGDLAPTTAMTQCEVEARIGDVAVRLTSKTIDGIFPDYSKVIPRGEGVVVSVATADLRRAVQALTLPGGGYPALRLSFSPKGCLEIETTSSARAVGLSGKMCIDVEGFPEKRAGFAVGFNSHYMADLLAVLHGERIEFQFDLEHLDSAPAIVRDPADESLFAVQMPVRV